ncbi:TRAP transporter small permease [Marinobacter psychrophilus]|jgi:TRAP-type C4-dicarboxylate transport system permease small subunit|uniref:TRAP transporter small permease n=1 Tax=Marinobacter psychrophilus TaxID=330734 RepID=UPI001B6ADEEA|nr:TRAP transporter small permease subunit [Marinobacter psychrophilus]MBQ0761742.1 TRAP transporter small permease subunit [Marinobacter psychrophilus]MBQ0846400.1 TRAP transporter small permease subunit [Marinobacter psychrophilus]
MKLLQPLRQLSDWVNQAAIIACVACVLIMLGISFTAFIYKLVTGSSLSWTYSLARLFLPWIGFLSMTISLRYGEHVAMTLLVRSLPRALLTLAAALCLITIALFGALLLWYGWTYFATANQVYMVSDQIQISAKFTTVVVPISGAIILLHVTQGFALLEHFIDDDALMDELIGTQDTETRS